MADTVSWVTPLLLLPGVALLLVSTSARYEAVHQEIHTLLGEVSSDASHCAQHVVRRARLLQSAMLALYGAVALLSTSGLVASITLWGLGLVH